MQRSPLTRRSPLGAVLAVGALGLFACGGDDEPGTEPTEPIEQTEQTEQTADVD
ncbi:hypothetical protein BH18ACT3_BH18ACT3_29280 [soil metagenome]